MKNYDKEIIRKIDFEGGQVASFMTDDVENLDQETVDSFGEEWSKFSSFTPKEIEEIGNEYFDIVDETMLNKSSRVLDIGCGTGRWALYVAQRADFVEAIDPSKAIYAAIKLSESYKNIRVTHAGVDEIPFEDNSFDFVYSLGVFHHLPDTQKAINRAVEKVKPGGHFLIYLYYALDNKGPLFRFIFHISNFFRAGISKLPKTLKFWICDIIAVLVYWPLAKFSAILNALFSAPKFVEHIPLSWYADKTFHVMRNDALDRFGTPLEKRFSKVEIQAMLEKANLTNITFSDKPPYWHVVAQKK